MEEVDGFFDRVLPGILKAQVERYFKDVENPPEKELIPHLPKKIVDKGKEAECRAQDRYVFSFCTTNDTSISKHGLLSHSQSKRCQQYLWITGMNRRVCDDDTSPSPLIITIGTDLSTECSRSAAPAWRGRL
jgi:hypothetical protein